MNIKMNMGGIDRVVRTAVSLGLIYIGFINSQLIDNHIINYLIGGFGLLNLFSSLVGFCPVYFLAHISTFRQPDSTQN